MLGPRPSRASAVAVALATLAGALMVAEPAAAHTGLPAGGALDGIGHPLLGIDHLLAIVAVGVLAATSRERRIAWTTPLGFVGGMVAGGVLGLAAMPLPAVELVIVASVIALGVMIAAGATQHGWWLPVVAASFGAAHGHAHGAELPAGAVPIAYVAGFVVVTALLHASGAAAGLGLRRVPVARAASGAMVAAAGVSLLLAG